MVECKEKSKELKEYVSIFQGDMKGLKTAGEEEIKQIEALTPPAQTRIMSTLRSFITEQQEEYFRLHKELALLVHDNAAIVRDIGKALEHIEQLEESLGAPPKA